MKKEFYIAIILSSALKASAQDTYLNTQMTNAADVIGTARFVSMGGAMGALGADVSTISCNPAGIAMMKKTDVSITAGAVWQGQKCPCDFGYSPAHATVDQAGFVTPFRTGSNDGLVNFNFAFNYQKKIDYNQAFGGYTVTNSSFIDVLNNSSVGAYRNGIFSPLQEFYEGGQSVTSYNMASSYGVYPTTRSNYVASGNGSAVSSSGFMASYDFNLSANISNRFFFGVTFGVDNVRFTQDTYYGESGVYLQDLVNNLEFINRQVVRGNGFNVKFGGIVRPFEDNSFRIGLAIETPTWYKLEYTDDQALYNEYADDVNGTRYSHVVNNQILYGHYVNDHNEGYGANYLRYKLITPWKFRVQLGGTIAKQLALGAEYEYAMYNWTTMKYPDGWGYTSDKGIDDWTERMIRGQHTLRLGLEFKPTEKFAIRAGYNAISGIYKDEAYWDNRASVNAINYPTSFQYTNFGMTNIITVGIGYRSKYFYADLAYKCRLQNGNHYAYNSMQQIADDEWSKDYDDRYFQGIDYGTEAAARQAGGMSSIPVSLTRHSIVATIGFKF